MTETLALTFKPTAVPAPVKSAAVNPLLDVVQKLAADRKQALTVAIADEKRRATTIRQAQEAGREVGVTVRTLTKDDTVTLWAIDRRAYKPRKPADQTAAAPVETSPTA